MSDEEIKSHLIEDKIKYTENTLIDNEAIIEDLAKSRERGYAIDEIEHENGVRCVGLPVTDRNDCLIGAISASGPVSVITENDVESISLKLMTAAFEIKSRI